MRYSQLFVQVAQMAESDPVQTEEKLRYAESLAMQSWPADLILCTRCWQDYLHDYDNAKRCLLEAECRSQDSAAFITLAEVHLKHFKDPTLAERCCKKALVLAKSEDEQEKIKEFLLTYAADRGEQHTSPSHDKNETT